MEGGEKNDFMSEQDFLASSYPSDGSHGSRGKGPNGKKVLVLGGTAFIGRTVVATLRSYLDLDPSPCVQVFDVYVHLICLCKLRQEAYRGIQTASEKYLAERGYSLVLINRGRSYWDGKRVAGAQYVKADRRDATAFTKCLDTLTQKEADEGRGSWLAVVDFSAYKPTEMQASLDGLRGRFDIYIYISSDSVYEVCDAELWRDSKYVDESHAVRPVDEARIRILRKKDSYGHNKLAVEEILRESISAHHRPVVALRLADVIGPYDDTDRFWPYFLWCQVSGQHPVTVEPSALSQRLNFTYSKDVARTVASFLVFVSSRRNSLPSPSSSVGLVENQKETPQINGLLASTLNPPGNAETAGPSFQNNENQGLFTAFNIACEDTVTLVELLELMFDRYRTIKNTQRDSDHHEDTEKSSVSRKEEESGDALEELYYCEGGDVPPGHEKSDRPVPGGEREKTISEAAAGGMRGNKALGGSVRRRSFSLGVLGPVGTQAEEQKDVEKTRKKGGNTDEEAQDDPTKTKEKKEADETGKDRENAEGDETDGRIHWRVEEDLLKCSSFLPSVCRETPLSMDKMKQELGLQPTPLVEAVQATCDWLHLATTQFPNEASEAAQKLPLEARQALQELHEHLEILQSSSASSSSSTGSSSSPETSEGSAGRDGEESKSEADPQQ